ncbi:bifunctional diguanylate cyclase/phosphodiesterase [Noviherbaspirillum galbum]|uniref:EAL domain-containing protein n=1 Tax=Noviherbaspirillum galbum TaxID=2709383 RepID=A0A6B3STJ3_9BURK|nr:EAL domain-containing protein [Noviherbaspirillum galbum]NEX63951.1 EAL domain-containing protein [Noviherbaspirillum galbum]
MKRQWALLLFWPVKSLILAAIGWNLLFAHLEDKHRLAEAEALQEAEAISRTFARHVDHALEAVDQISLYVKNGWELTGGNFRLDQMAKVVPIASNTGFFVTIVNASGDIVTSNIPDARKTNVSQQDFFMHSRADPEQLYIGVARIGLFSGTPVVPFSRALNDRQGRFDGIVLVSVIPEYFISSFDEAALKKRAFLGIMSADHKLRLARIDRKVFLPDRSDAVLKRSLWLPSAEGNQLLSGRSWFADDRSRYLGWQSTPNYGMVTLAGLDQEEALEEFFSQRDNMIRQGIWATAILAVLTLTAMLVSLHIVWRRYQVQSMQMTYRTATEVGEDGYLIAQPISDQNGKTVDFTVVDCNERAAGLLRYRRQDLVGQKVSALYQGEAGVRTMRMLCKAMKVGFYEGETELAEIGLEGGPKWLHIRISRPDNDLAITLRDITEIKSHVAELERRGNEDALTGLPNRHWLNAYLPQAVERAAGANRMLGLLFIDLDGFKAVNDTLGHKAGDEILRNAAHRLKDATRPQDHVVRIGGDEFLVILERIGSAFDAAHVAERIIDAFGTAFRIEQGVRSIGASIGISLYPINGGDANTLLNNADIAMYSVKTSSKGSYRFFDSEYSENVLARHRLEAELRHALEQDQFVVFYQPRVEMAGGTTSSMEALVRWMHPTRGLIEPNEFIPLAEETGLIVKLGWQVMEKVCSQVAFWSAQGRQTVPVSVNVSARQFQESDVAAIVQDCLQRHAIDPSLIEIELTESSMLDDKSNVVETLQHIQKMGVKLLVDDFGTGYSSLSQLQRLDFDVIKVDRAFTAELDNSREGTALITAIITMAHALGIRVVAEGVESLEQVATLRALHCDEVQGFLISRPLPAAEIQPMLGRWLLPVT